MLLCVLYTCAYILSLSLSLFPYNKNILNKQRSYTLHSLRTSFMLTLFAFAIIFILFTLGYLGIDKLEHYFKTLNK